MLTCAHTLGSAIAPATTVCAQTDTHVLRSVQWKDTLHREHRLVSALTACSMVFVSHRLKKSFRPDALLRCSFTLGNENCRGGTCSVDGCSSLPYCEVANCDVAWYADMSLPRKLLVRIGWKLR